MAVLKNGDEKREQNAFSCHEKAVAILDNLRELKSRLEGNHFEMQQLHLDPDAATQLKLLTVVHTPATMTEDHRDKLAVQIAKRFAKICKKVLFACVMTCPWFAASQSEETARAKHNVLFVVFLVNEEHFLSLATPHEKELQEVINEDWLCAVEARHFSHHLQRGNIRFAEAFGSPENGVIINTSEFQQLQLDVSPDQLINKHLLEKCRGQAFGGVFKKKKDGRLVMKEDTTLQKICDSFRLLNYARQAVTEHQLTIGVRVESNSDAQQVVRLLGQLQEDHISRDQLLGHLLQWKSQVDDLCEQAKDLKTSNVSERVKKWLWQIRTVDISLAPPQEPGPDALAKIQEIGKLVGSPLSELQPNSLVVLCKAGSHMYNLSTPQSDTDYLAVYVEPHDRIFSSSDSLKEALDTRGQHNKYNAEVAGYEVRLFCEMLLKGSVNIFELLFSDNFAYESTAWKDLRAKREQFMTEKVILQYLGYVKTHMKLIEGEKHKGTPREQKLFYHVLHKMASLERFAKGKLPQIQLSGSERDFILSVRKGPLTGGLDRDKLLHDAKQRLQVIRHELCSRTTRLPELGNYKVLQDWLIRLRLKL
ncbi:uncharacterized protein LOC134191942 isoform X2 [Corticium candelabrum]|uniref:uncharacterized protein LOC134191942 isoform X2 n=1 Tax=Corticium candelabrum TaxID=121492 RepID=UPI002E260A11|nr:uncharacterized protein LOC134191942 isoform X2 [Corticium candelabrum]